MILIHLMISIESLDNSLSPVASARRQLFIALQLNSIFIRKYDQRGLVADFRFPVDAPLPESEIFRR